MSTVKSKKTARAQAKNETRKAVVRPVLASPFAYSLPTLSSLAPAPAHLERITAALVELLKSHDDGKPTIADWRDHEARRRKQSRPKKRRKAAKEEPSSSKAAAMEQIERPGLLNHLVIGINDVTRALETRIRWGRWHLGDEGAIPPGSDVLTRPAKDSPDDAPYVLRPSPAAPLHRLRSNALLQQPAESTSATPMLDMVFVCGEDIDPPSLVGHLPTTCAACNGVATALRASRLGADTMQSDKEELPLMERSLFLIPLAKGAEVVLGDALGLPRVAALGLSGEHPRAEELLRLLQAYCKRPEAPWLVPHLVAAPAAGPQPPVLANTHIKHLKTTAPANPKVAREAREAAKAARRDRKRKASGQGGDKQEQYIAED